MSKSKKRKREVVDDGWNRYAFNDTDDAPLWFVDDERKHNKPKLPITKEEVEAMKARAREINARPMKKVAEAKARKQRRKRKQIEKVKEQAQSIANQSEMTELEKIRQIQQLYKNTGKQPKNSSVYIVRNKWQSKGFKSGLKSKKGGKVKLVDPRKKR
eukprot:TRINITY_DN14500_c0_g1_i1.p1 TRINITY_DN14500_c0_g1~~TRINITY_DN14500_c0_g1_i1.p1  ORF type:complete len:158 (-),score=49.80 TRINITY_DN14500_c0_g1_i1:144-617(-)